MRAVASIVIALIGLIGVTGATAPARAQGQCVSLSQCQKSCPTSGCTETPPAMLVKDAGPEPARTIETLRDVNAVGQTANNDWEWSDTRDDAIARAVAHGKDKLHQACRDWDASSSLLEDRVATEGQQECRKASLGGKEQWNCTAKVKGVCRKEDPNPAHEVWVRDKAQQDADERKRAGLEAKWQAEPSSGCKLEMSWFL